MGNYANPAEWLDSLSSHGIYNASILDELKEWNIDISDAPVVSGATMKQAIIDRGLGGTFTGTDDEPSVAGHSVARWLAVKLTGKAPGDQYFGRGRSFDADYAAVRRYCQKVVKS